MSPPCLDCGTPLPSLSSEEYPTDANATRCYLCPFCRTHRYNSEPAALSRCRAGMARRFPERDAQEGQR